MRGPRRRAWGVLVVATMGTVGLAFAPQDPPANTPKKAATPKDKASKRAGLRAGGGAAPKKTAGGVDPLTKQAPGAANAIPEGPVHFRLKIAGLDGTPLAALYYPSPLGPNAPVVMLVHERGVGRSSKDFEDSIADAKDKGLAAHLQGEDYAVLVVDLRGHGSNPRHEVAAREWAAMTRDLQTAYLFLVDRHNRRELNVAKLGVLALGDAGSLVAAWAAGPDGAVASEGRVSDLGALVMVSPVEDASGLRVDRLIPPLAPRLPILVLAGKKDEASTGAVRAIEGPIARQARSKVVSFDTSLHGFKLLRLFPKVVEPIDTFLKETIKIRLIDWEPRYLLTPVSYPNVELVSPNAPAPAANAPAPAPEPATPKRVTTPAPKKKAGS